MESFPNIKYSQENTSQWFELDGMSHGYKTIYFLQQLS